MSDDAVATLELAGGRTLVVVEGDLLTQPVDAIVNAANSHLAHGGGVAALIARAAGPELYREGKAIVGGTGPVEVGHAVVTTAGDLPFEGVIHAVGPRQGEDEEEAKLASAVAAAMARAAERGWSSVAMPAISSGIFGVPFEVCARAYVAGVRMHVEQHPESSVREVRLCLVDEPLVEAVKREIDKAAE